MTRGACHTSLFAMWSRRSGLIGALLVSLPSSLMVEQDRPVFSTESDLIVVHATIKDRGGAYVTGLTRDAFAILEDGRPQSTQLFTSEDAPVTAGLLIDSSGSMQPNRERVIAAAAAFAKASHPSDELFALGFNDSVTAALPADGAVHQRCRRFAGRAHEHDSRVRTHSTIRRNRSGSGLPWPWSSRASSLGHRERRRRQCQSRDL